MNQRSALVAAAIAAVLLPSSSALGETSSASDATASGSDTGVGDPVTVAILDPADGAEVSPELTVTVMTEEVAGDALIESVQLTVDGELQPESCDASGTCMFEIELEPGTHMLVAIASLSGAEYSDSIEVTAVEAPVAGATTGGESGDPPDGPTGDAGVDAGATDEGGTDDANADDLDSEKSGCACTAGSDRDRAPLLLALLGLIPVLRRRVRH